MTTANVLGIVGLVALVMYSALIWYPNYIGIKRILRSLNNKLGIPATYAQFRYKFRTPAGVCVRSTVNVPQRQRELIDSGIRKQLERVNRAQPLWNKGSDLYGYNILVIDPMAVNVVTEPGSPALKVFGVQCAGTCIGVFPHDDVKQPYIVVPHQEASNWQYEQYWENSIWYESEHVRESLNDTGIFMSFEGTDDVHPHWP